MIGAAGATPVPVKLADKAPEAFETIFNAEFLDPVEVGLNCVITVQVPFNGMLLPATQVPPVIEKSVALERPKLVIFNVPGPLFVKVNVLLVLFVLVV